MAVANLTSTKESIVFGNDNIVIRDVFEDIRGGRTLDVTGFTPEVIKAGHVIIKEAATGEFKPMPLSGEAYAALPEGHTYAGILIASIPTNQPFAGIMIRGNVNHNAAPFPMATILAAVKTALPLITFLED